jgi:hypothetical protein
MAVENQHWVPKLLLKRFADADGRVYRLDKLTDEVTKPPPRLAASAAGFNDYEIEGEFVSFEDRLEKVETKAAPVLDRFIRARALLDLTAKERKRVSDFVAAQSFRTEAFYKGLESQPSRQEYGPLFKRLWDSAFILSARIQDRHWALSVIESDDVFYLGDQPVVFQRTRDPKDGNNLGFDVEGVEAFMPLSPKCALYMPCRSVSREIVAAYEAALSLHRAVRTAVFNGASGGTAALIAAQDTIRRSHELYKAFTTGSPIKAHPENIENLNYLQCSFGHVAVYSNRRDFTFARHVFKNTPQYRSTPKTRLLDATALIPDSVDPVVNGW